MDGQCRDGRALLAAGHYQQALRILTRPIELDPGNARTIALRGEAYLAMGRHEEARADFARATELDPGYIPPQGPGSEPDSV
jgi:Flp pilus assembly protein TadD